MDDCSAAHKEQSIPDNLNNPADIQVPVQRSAPSASATVAVGGASVLLVLVREGDCKGRAVRCQ
jgi:hypothetical protein